MMGISVFEDFSKIDCGHIKVEQRRITRIKKTGEPFFLIAGILS
jgi:hypothetical protein